MKKLVGLGLLLGLLLSLCACGCKQVEMSEKDRLTWQEQYDLGIRYLSEGNYEEAIIAFMAAIEIDPKASAAYLSAADTYIALGEEHNAISILESGYEATEDTSILERLEEIDTMDTDPESTTSDHQMGDSVNAIGTFFLIGDEYESGIDALFDSYGDIIVRSAVCGVRFNEPIETVVEGNTVVIQEAELWYVDAIQDETVLYSYTGGEQVAGELIGKGLRLNGYFSLNSQQSELEGPKDEYAPGMPAEAPIYDFQPTGPYVFTLVSYEIVN